MFVSELCLGAMTFGGRGQMWEVIGGLDQAAVDAIVHRALDGGINFIDTADVYSAGESEVMVGKAIEGRRHDVVLATKVRGRIGPDRTRSASRASTSSTASKPASSGSTPTTSTSTRFIASIRSRTSRTRCARWTISFAPARVRYIGCSNLPAWFLMKSLAVSREQRIERFECTQS